jgi:hypothetical protein
MTVSTFESLPIDVLFEITGYLSPVSILQSFLPMNQRLSRVVIYEYLWHIAIGDSAMSFSMFNDTCQNVLKLIGSRLVSLRVIQLVDGHLFHRPLDIIKQHYSNVFI